MEDGVVLGRIPITISPYTFKLKQISVSCLRITTKSISLEIKKLNQPETLYLIYEKILQRYLRLLN